MATAENFFGFTIGSVLGIAVESTYTLGWPFAILLGFLSVLIALLAKRSGASLRGFTIAILLLGCSLGIFRTDVSRNNRNMHSLDSFMGETVQLNGVVVEEPDARETNTNIIFETHSVNGTTVDATRILVNAPTYPEIQYGDELSISGKIITPKNFAPADGQQAFDYRAYLAKDDIYYKMPFSKISIVDHGKGAWIMQKLFAVKHVLLKNISSIIPEPESSLAGGIVLGTKQSLGKELMKKFRDAGLAHIVVLSGYNITVVANVIASAASFLPFTARLASSALGIILFALMVGGGATVLRATLMALVIIIARAVGRESDALRVLVFVGWVMVMVNPAILLSDVSFQLSFMAALSLVTFVPRIEKYFLFVKYEVLREILVTTIATQLFVAPILLYQMGNFSLVGFVANIFVLPIVPLAMLLVAIVSVVSMIPLLGALVVFPTQLLLAYILRVVDIGSRASFANVHVASFGIIALVISYIIIFLACVMLSNSRNEK